MIDGGEDDILTLTTSQDVAKVVALAIEHEGEWPLVSGIKGGEITVGQLIALGEKIRGTCSSRVYCEVTNFLNQVEVLLSRS